jgi:hypothetical protein
VERRVWMRWAWRDSGGEDEDEDEDEEEDEDKAIEVGRKIGGRKIGEAVGMGEGEGWRVEGGEWRVESGGRHAER